ncbi:MAG: hypothetical protein ABIA02_01885 [Candidatus Falkowbacteria bacterium]
MSAKDLTIEFINMVFMIFLIAFCIFYFIAGDRFAMLAVIMESLMPLAVFGIAFLIKLKLSRRILKKRTREDNLSIILYLTYFDKLKTDIIIYLLPIIVLLISFIYDRNVDLVDIFQALIVFLIVYFWQKMLFKKEG